MMMMERETIVIGASVAGSYFAYLLGLNSQDCTVIDYKESHGKKACGESLTTNGKRYLQRTGFWEGGLEQYATPYFAYDLTLSESTKAEIRSSAPIGYSIERTVMDRALFDSATLNAHTEFINEKVLSVIKSGESWIVKTSSAEYRAKTVVIASGASGRYFCENGTSAKPLRQRYGISFKCHGKWNSYSRAIVNIKSTKNHQFIVNPVSQNTINVNILINKEISREMIKAKDKLIVEALNYAESLGFVIQNQERCQGASSLSSSQAGSPPDGIYYIGDAAEVFDPIGGLGMSHALFSASLAADYVIKNLESEKKSPKMSRKYFRRRNIFAKIFRLQTALSYNLIVKQTPSLIFLVTKFPYLAHFVNKLIGCLLPIIGAASRIQPVADCNFYQTNS